MAQGNPAVGQGFFDRLHSSQHWSIGAFSQSQHSANHRRLPRARERKKVTVLFCILILSIVAFSVIIVLYHDMSAV